ncbi:Golgi apyrase [Coemansia sp. RSA 2702]|nr:Golgi apyrase [Coemansia sp. RSA 2702]
MDGLGVLPGGGNGSVRRRWPRPRRLAGVLAALALLVLCALALWARRLAASDATTGDSRRFGIVIDAGSSGSRLMVYAWDAGEQSGNHTREPSTAAATDAPAWRLPEIQHVGEQKTTPGISTFDAARVGAAHIKPLLDYAYAHIPRAQHAGTPVTLLATAGMRLVSRAQQRAVLGAACAYARRNYGFLVDCAAFRVASGEEEGLFGWIAVNYLMRAFDAPAGFLDMGGASAQIAFAPGANDTSYADDGLARVTLRGVDGRDRVFPVFVATFLGHGTNEARRRYVAQLVGAAPAANGTAVLDDPCLAPELVLPTGDGRAVLRGRGNFAACVASTAPLLNKTACALEPCLLGGRHAPRIDFSALRFVGVSEYWYASNDHLRLGGAWDAARFEQRAAAFCAEPWAAALATIADARSEAAVARLQMQCFKAAWLVNVLHEGFGLPRDAAPFESVERIAGAEVSWALGAQLLRVSRMIAPSSDFSSGSDSSPGSNFNSVGIRLPSHLAASDDDDDDLRDSMLWSPLRFGGLRRMLVLWALLPPTERILAAAAVALAVGAVAALMCWLLVRPRRRKRAETETDELVPLDVLGSPPAARRALSAVLESATPPISRSSSVSNLALLNRRRGAV